MSFPTTTVEPRTHARNHPSTLYCPKHAPAGSTALATRPTCTTATTACRPGLCSAGTMTMCLSLASWLSHRQVSDTRPHAAGLAL